MCSAWPGLWAWAVCWPPSCATPTRWPKPRCSPSSRWASSRPSPPGEALFFDYLEAPAALILQADSTPKAFYLACTHFGCIVKWRVEEKDFFCPCHAGVFAPDGTVLAGPPPSPLVELKVVVEGDLLFVEGTVS
ncbi:MAG: Rieske (2Fe-2S) protein [Thermoleophilia bacterium]|nr:Rieske (2Fe-2S) protein [Thermoleophilia bacterium]